MTVSSRVQGTLTFLILLYTGLFVPEAYAQDWRHDASHLAITPPTGWTSMDSGKLAYANQKVSHITGSEFIAGFEMGESPKLVFPYMLVQFRPYSRLPEGYLPVLKPKTDYDRLMVAIRMTGAFKLENPLHPSITAEQFIEKQSGVYATLVSLDDSGKFALNGTIPQEDGSGEIAFHSHGVMGKHGVAIVTLFGNDHQFFQKLHEIIEGPMQTLAFDAGYAYNDMPASAEEVTAAPPNTSSDPNTKPTTSGPTYGADKPDTNTQADNSSAQTTAAQTGDSTTLFIVLGVLGGSAIIVLLIIIIVMQSQNTKKRNKARSRRGRASGAYR